MRIYIKLSKNTKAVPYNHQHKLVGAIHNRLGENDLHGKISLYSFSRLQGGRVFENGLDFRHGADWFISFYDNYFLKDLIFGLMKDKPEICYGMRIETVLIRETPDLTNTEYFKIASPVLIKRNIKNSVKHFLYTDKESPDLLRETLLNKMKTVGLSDTDLQIKFDLNYRKATTKLINYRGIKNKTSWCPIIIKGKHETKQFAWNVGVGNSTGIGFGAII